VLAILPEGPSFFLFLGETEGQLDGAGTLAIHSQQTPGLTCIGQFTSSAELGGRGQLHCSDGSSAIFHFQRLGMRKGHGAGSFSRGAMSFSYGLAAREAAPYLKLPEGKKLAYKGKEPALVELPDERSPSCPRSPTVQMAAMCATVQMASRAPNIVGA
jgi:hypothetical protein